ncbi:MAG: PAS domain S-box protein [Pseudomonadota bacterium]
MLKKQPDINDATLLDAMFEAVIDAIIVTDATGTILRTNASATKMLGFEACDMLGQNVRMLMPIEDAQRHDSYIKHHVKTGKSSVIGTGRELMARHRDGHCFPIHISLGRVEVSQGPIFVAVMHDLSDRKAAEEALSRSQRLEAVGQMTGGITHDFNNLLTIIIGNLELLQRGSEGRFGELVSDALEAAELGADLTSRLLAFARKSDLSPKMLNLAEECDEVVRILSRTLGASFEIECLHAPNLPNVNVDPTQLQTAIMNLALNARDAMPDGGRLLIQTDRVQIDDTYIAQEIDIVPGDYVRLSVSDTGTGMDDIAKERAFEPFFTTKPAGKGTGLGLSMVYGFSRQSGGHVTLYSEVGHGTTVALYFPVLENTEAASKEASACTPVTPGRGQVILVVEDNASVRRLAVVRLRELGYKTLEAETGDDALELLREIGQVDLLFTDMVMPGQLDGYQLAKEAQSLYPQMKFLLTSGYSKDIAIRQEDKERFPLLHKPYRMADLAEHLKKLLSDD